jgi:cobyrinic acid a,c-diamide synthase
MLPRVLIAGVESSSGKTTVSLGLMLALKARGLTVQPFKVGPDFIDPSHHTRICGRPSRNLDTWMCEAKAVLEIFQRGAQGADVSVIEGVMGLFDGFGPGEERGSTAHLAKLLKAPIILVLDAAKTATSTAAIALGCREFDKQLQIAGVIFNRVGSPGHYHWLKHTLEKRVGIPSLGYLRYDPALNIEERYLGLIPSWERGLRPVFYERLMEQVKAHVDLDGVLEIACSAPSLPALGKQTQNASQKARVNIGIAFDQAFHFYYQDNLDLLEALGARLVYFSPLKDSQLPHDLHGLYIGGGFPEVFAKELAQNTRMKESIWKFYQAGAPIYAECGGLMYLCEALIDFEGHAHEMVGLVPARTIMQRAKLSLGYVEVEVLKDNILSHKGERFRGQTFHYSVLEGENPDPCYLAKHGENLSYDGYSLKNLLATYIHAHFVAAPQLAENFVQSCLGFKNREMRQCAL